jgi:hypothetical protein
MDTNGLLGNLQILGYLAVAAALRDTRKHLSFAWRELNGRHSLCETVKGSMGKITQTSIDVLDGVQKFFTTSVFCEVSHRAASHGSVDVFTTLVVRQHNDTDAGKFSAQLCDHIEATDARQTKVKNNDVGAQLTVHRDAKFTIACLSDYLDLRMARKNRVKRHASEKMIFDEENSNLLHMPIQRIT